MAGPAPLHRPDPGALRVDAAAGQAARRHRAASRWSCGSPSARARAAPPRSWIATDDERIVARRTRARLRRDHDPRRPCDRHRPPRRGRGAARARRRRDRGQRPGRRAADPARSGRAARPHARAAQRRGDRHRLRRRSREAGEFFNPNVVKVVSTRRATRCTSAARRFPGPATRSRRPRAGGTAAARICRSTVTTASTPTARVPRSPIRAPRRRRSSASRRWSSCARSGTATASQSWSAPAPPPGVDTPEDLAHTRRLFAQ